MSHHKPRRRETEFYERLRKTVRRWAGGREGQANRYLDLILAGPDLFMLLVRLSRDDRLSRTHRARLTGAVAYFVNPFDLIPEALLGPPGLLDDLALSAIVLHEVLETTDPALIREQWEGSMDLLEVLRQITAVADTMVGGPVWRQLLTIAQSFVPHS